MTYVTTTKYVITKGQSVLVSAMPNSMHLKPDYRIISHIIDGANNDITSTTVRANDTDIFVLLIAHLTQILEINNNFSLTLISGAGDNKFVYNINNIIQNLGSRKCTVMLFLHAFIGSNYKSSFYGVRKLKLFDVFFKTEKYDETFIRLAAM